MNHEFWYLSRAAGFTAYGLLFVTVALGMLIGTRLADRLVPRHRVFDVHRFTSVLALGFSAFHVYVLLGDGYFDFDVWQLSLPLGSPYRPWQTAAGVAGLYMLLLITASFFVRKLIGYRAWRVLHYATFALFAAVTWHGITAGTDTATAWARAIYLFAGASVAMLLAYRIVYRMPSGVSARRLRALSGLASAGVAAYLLVGAGIFSSSANTPGMAQTAPAATSAGTGGPLLSTFTGGLNGEYSVTSDRRSEQLVLDADTSGDLRVSLHIELVQRLAQSGDDDDDERDEREEEAEDREDGDRAAIVRNVAQLRDPDSGDLLCDGTLTEMEGGFFAVSCDGVGPYDGIAISIESTARATGEGTLSGTVRGRMQPA